MMKNKLTFLLTVLALLACFAFSSGRAEAQLISPTPTSISLTYGEGNDNPEGQYVYVSCANLGEDNDVTVVLDGGTSSHFEFWYKTEWVGDHFTATNTDPYWFGFGFVVRLKPGYTQGSNHNDVVTLSATVDGNTVSATVDVAGTVTSPTYHISFDLGEENGNYHGYVIHSPGEDVPQGTQVTLMPKPEPGYAISSWTVNKQQGDAWVVDNSVYIANNQFTMPDHDIQIVPTFVPTTQNSGYYTVTFQTEPSITTIPQNASYLIIDSGEAYMEVDGYDNLSKGPNGLVFKPLSWWETNPPYLILSTTSQGKVKPKAIRLTLRKMNLYDDCKLRYSINDQTPQIIQVSGMPSIDSYVSLPIPSDITQLNSLTIRSANYVSLGECGFTVKEIEVKYEPAVTLSQNQFMLQASYENQETASDEFTVNYSGLTEGSTVEFHVQEGFQNGTVAFNPPTFTPSTSCGSQTVTVSWTPDHTSTWEYASCYMKCDAANIWYEHIGVNTSTTDHPCYTMRPTVTLSDIGSQSVTVNWTSNENPIAWDVQCSLDPNFPQGAYTIDNDQLSSSASDYTISQLMPEATYYVRVAPWCEAANEFGPWSEVVSFTTPDPCVLPTNVEVTETEAYNFTVSFRPAASDQTEWDFFWSNEFGASPSTMAVVNNENPSETITATLGGAETLYAGAFYYLWVGTKCGDETNWPSSPTTHFTTQSDCNAPTNLTTSDVSYTSATVSWTQGSENQDSWLVELDTQEWGEPREYFTNQPYITFTSNDFNTEGDGDWDGWEWHVTVVGNCGQGYGYSDPSETTFTTNMNSFVVNNNSSDNNEDVPINGNNTDYLTRSQFIIPATSLTPISGGAEINKITFACYDHASVSWGDAKFEVYMTTAPANYQFADNTFYDWNQMTKVYNAASLSVVNDEMAVTFSEPFQYVGGDLMIGVKQTQTGTYSRCAWKGVSTSYNSYQAIGGYQEDEVTSVYDRPDFLPQVTFGYTPGPCSAPTNFVYTDITSTSATVSWTSNADRHIFQYKREDEIGWHQYPLDNDEKQYQLTDLEPGVTYLVRVCALCSSGSTDYLEGSFATLHAAPANLTCTGKTVNTASFSWEDNSQPQNGWVMELYSDQSMETPRGTFTSSETNYTIDGVDGSGYPYLVQNNTYWVRVRGDYSENVFGEWTEALEFTTGVIKTFVGTQTESGFNLLWSEPENWDPVGVPTMSDNVSITSQNSPAIPADYVAEANVVTMIDAAAITIRQGGQLRHNYNKGYVYVNMRKPITYYTGSNDHYYLIAWPFEDYYGSYNQHPFIAALPANPGNYDLYMFDQSKVGEEWRNFKQEPFGLIHGNGYLYAEKNEGSSSTEHYVTFGGEILPSKDKRTSMIWNHNGQSTQPPFNGWCLRGNPFVCNAYIDRDYYRMVEVEDGGETTHSELQLAASTVAIAPLESVFVQSQSTAGSEAMYFSRDPQTGRQPALNINLKQTVSGNTTGSTALVDVARVRFGEGGTLEKFQIDPNHTKVFIPMEGKDYAVATAEGSIGEIPVSFKAEKNGTYTLGFANEEVEFGYLHLIDNMTGVETDLLQTPSYSFEARTTDYASRFLLRYATGSSMDAETATFAFINANGNLTLFGVDGKATLQVIDLTGRVLSSETFSGSYEKRINAAPGVYMLRLINGADVKVQKVVVR